MRTFLVTTGLAIAVCAAVAAGCHGENASQSGDVTAAECSNAYRDSYGYCRNAQTGRFAKEACCQLMEACAVAALDEGGYCRRKDNGQFAPKVCCSGDQPLVCEPGTFAVLPQATGYALACDAALGTILEAPVSTASVATVTASERCALSPLGALAWEYYRSYWDTVYPGGTFDELTGGDDVALEVAVSRHGAAGTIVSVDMNADEDQVIFVFDENETLLLVYHYEQSSVSYWYCADGAPAPPEPGESCVGRALHQLPQVSAMPEAGTTTPAGAANLSPLLGHAVNHFALAQNLAPTAAITYDGLGWNHPDWGPAMRVTLTAEGAASATYAAAAELDGYDPMVIMALGEAGHAFVCE